MVEEAREEPERDESGEEPAEEPGTDAPRIPEPRDEDRDTKRYMVSGDGASLRVRVSGGDIGRNYGPARLLGELAEKIAQLVEQFNGGRAVLYRLEPGQSMVLYLGDPQPGEAQRELPIQQTLVAAGTVADLIELEGDELFARALEIGSPIQSYDALARFVASEGITLDWAPADRRPATLEPQRAASHHERLSAEPVRKDREMPLNGVLYRLIEDPAAKRGRIGIGLFEWSLEPPGYKAPGKVPAIEFEGPELYDKIQTLTGKSVEATVLVREPQVGSTVDLSRVTLQLIDIQEGEGEVSAYGISLFEPEDE